MKVAVDVKDRKEGEAIKTALGDPETRAFVVIVGTLLQLPSERARKRVLQFVSDHQQEEAAIRDQD